MKFRHKALTIKKEIFLMSFAFLATVSLVFSGVFLHILYKKNMENAGNSLRECNAQIVIYTEGKYSLQGTTQGRYLTGGMPPVRFSM